MAEKGGTKILAIITICIMLISIGLSGCVGDDDKSNNDNDINYDGIYHDGNFYIEYSISIQSNNTYTIYSPIITTERYSVVETFFNFEVLDGNSTINLIEISSKDEKYYNLTEYPKNDPEYPEGNRDISKTNNFGINITGKSNSEIYLNITGDTYYSILTFEDYYANSSRLIYCKKNNPEQNITISLENYEKAYNRYSIMKKEDNYFYLDDGWNNIEIDGFGVLL